MANQSTDEPQESTLVLDETQPADKPKKSNTNDIEEAIRPFITGGKEDEHVELKRECNLANWRGRCDLITNVCALANLATSQIRGYLIIGVDEYEESQPDRDDYTVGLNFPITQERVEGLIKSHLKPLVDFTYCELEVNEKQIVVVAVERISEWPCYISTTEGEAVEGQVFFRYGKSTLRMELGEVTRRVKTTLENYYDNLLKNDQAVIKSRDEEIDELRQAADGYRNTIEMLSKQNKNLNRKIDDLRDENKIHQADLLDKTQWITFAEAACIRLFFSLPEESREEELGEFLALRERGYLFKGLLDKIKRGALIPD